MEFGLCRGKGRNDTECRVIQDYAHLFDDSCLYREQILYAASFFDFVVAEINSPAPCPISRAQPVQGVNERITARH